MSDVEVALSELPEVVGTLRPLDTLTIRGGGALDGADLTGLVAAQVDLLPVESFGALLRAALPAKLFVKVGRDIPIFNDCDFSGLRTWFNPGVARFYRCHFLGVEVRGALLQAHFVDCDFSGLWEANFTSEAAPEDPALRVNVSGNDFRGLRDMDFFGVPWDANLFDTAGAHLIVRRSHLADPAVMRTLRTTPDGASVLQRLQFGQEDWVLMQQGSSLTSSDWDALRAAIPRD